MECLQDSCFSVGDIMECLKESRFGVGDIMECLEDSCFSAGDIMECLQESRFGVGDIMGCLQDSRFGVGDIMECLGDIFAQGRDGNKKATPHAIESGQERVVSGQAAVASAVRRRGRLKKEPMSESNTSIPGTLPRASFMEL